jgi:transposase
MRERVLRLVKAGRSVREVAALVGVSKSLVAKLAKANRDELAA